MKIVFFGSTNLALPVLESLRTEHELAAVVTTPDSKAGRKQGLQETPVSALARDLGLVVFKPERIKDNQEFIEQLRKLNADIFIVVAYGKILPGSLIDLPKYKVLNVHPSVLPKYRGPSPIRSALLNGDEYTGITFILLDDQVDHGPMLAQQIVKIEPDDNDFILTDKLGHVAAAAINSVIADYISGVVTPLPQDESRASHTAITNKQDGKVDWNKSATQVYNQFRAFYIWPEIWTEWNGKKIKITDCLLTAELASEIPGTVLAGGSVACGGGSVLQIKMLKPEGKNDMPIADFLNGYKDFIGAKLG